MSNTLSNCRTGNGLEKSFAVPRGLGRLLDQFFRNDAGPAPIARGWMATANLWEDENAFHVEVDFPGVKRDDIDLVVEKDLLRIKAQRKLPEGERKYWHQERGYGEVERVITLPETVNPEQIEATLTEGVLHVTLGKRPEDQPRKIVVKA